MTYAKRRALFVTATATLWGIFGWVVFVTDWRESLPLGIFFVLLVINTYPSVQLFSSIVPQDDGRHALIDMLIAFVYFTIAVSLGQPQQFALCTLVLFLIAAGKYSMMFYEIPHHHLVQRKVRVDLLGALLCAGVLEAMVLGYSLPASWAMTIIFALANVYVLLINPLYRV